MTHADRTLAVFAMRVVRAARPRPARIHDREFWITQILVGLCTATVYTTHALFGLGGGFHDLPIMFFIIPVGYATIVYGFEGAVLTGLWAVLLNVPHATLISNEENEWLGDMGTLTILVVASIALAIRVERERESRQRAEAVSHRLALLNDIGGVLARSRSIPELVQDFADRLQTGLDLDVAWVYCTDPRMDEIPVLVHSGRMELLGTAEDLETVSVYALGEGHGGDAPRRTRQGWLVAPLIAGERSFGVVGGVRSDRPLSGEEEQVIATAARQASTVLDSMLLQREHRERLTSYARQLTNAQEEERRRIARELHDGVTQALSGLCRGFDVLRAELDAPDGDPLATTGKMRRVAEEALRDIRRLSRDLRPTILDDLGLVSAIRWLVTDLEIRLGITVGFNTAGTPRGLSAEQELTIFRITQETLRNVEKYAHAALVDVELAFDAELTRVTVRDDGRGFEVPSNLADLARRARYGLVGMQERAALNGGSLTVHSRPGEGTLVVLEMQPATLIGGDKARGSGPRSIPSS